MSVLVLALMVALTAFGTWIALRTKCLSVHPIRLGIWFGFLAVIANTASLVAVREYGIAIGLRDAPVVVAGIFFGPVAGLVAGAIAAIERALTPLWGIGTANLCPFATFLTGAFAALINSWILSGRKPRLVPALVFGVFAEIFHLAMDFLFCFGNYTRFVEIVYAAFIPEALGIAASMGLAAVICGSAGTLRENFRSFLTRILLFFSASLAIIAAICIRHAYFRTETDLQHALQTFDSTLEDQIGYILHCNAVSIVDRIRQDKGMSLAKMQQLLEEYDVDEINVFDHTGRLLISTDEQVAEVSGVGFNRQSPVAAPFFDLVDGKSRIVIQRFRTSVSNPEVVAKYVGVPLEEGRTLLQLGYSWKRLEREFSTFFFPMVGSMPVGDSGYYLVINKNGYVGAAAFGHPGLAGKTRTEIGFPSEDFEPAIGRHFSAHVLGVWSRIVRYKAIGDWRVYAVLPFAETHAPVQALLFLVGSLFFLCCMIFYVVMTHFRRQQQQIEGLRAKDMTLAKTIQFSSLPIVFPDRTDYRISARMDTAREVGGDFYDFYPVSEDRILVLIADVSGKGIAAALFMMRAKVLLRSAVTTYPNDLAAAIVTANNTLAEQNDAEMFVTAWIGIYNRKTGEVEFVNAGHNPPLVRHENGSVEWVRERSGLVLAAMVDAPYRLRRISLRPGDTLLLYTDGVTEAMNPAGELYGEARLEWTLSDAGNSPINVVRKNLATFVAGAEQSDDITMLSLEVKLKNDKKESIA